MWPFQRNLALQTFPGHSIYLLLFCSKVNIFLEIKLVASPTALQFHCYQIWFSSFGRDASVFKYIHLSFFWLAMKFNFSEKSMFLKFERSFVFSFNLISKHLYLICTDSSLCVFNRRQINWGRPFFLSFSLFISRFFLCQSFYHSRIFLLFSSS